MKYIAQSILGMAGVSIYILVDTYFISRFFGADGLAVLNLILPLYGVIYAIGEMIGIGSATVYGIDHAAKKDTRGAFLHSVVLTSLCSVPFIVLGALCPQRVLALLGADEALIALGTGYVRTILLFSPLFMLNYSFSSFARNDGGAGKAMQGVLWGNLFNIVFDYIFMVPMGLGFTGAAYATAGAPVIIILFCASHLLRKDRAVDLSFTGLSLKRAFRSCSLGFSSFVAEMSSGVTTIVYNFLLLALAGNTGVAAYGVIANISLVVVAVFGGIAQGAQPMVSQFYGKGDHVSVKKLKKAGLLITLAAEALIIAGMWCFAVPIAGIFNSEHSALLMEYAVPGVRLYFSGFAAAGMNIFLISFLSAVDDPKPAVAGSLLRGALAIVPCAIVMAKCFGIAGVWLSFLASECITLVCLALSSRNGKGKA